MDFDYILLFFCHGRLVYLNDFLLDEPQRNGNPFSWAEMKDIMAAKHAQSFPNAL